MVKAVIIDDEHKSIRNLQFLIETHCKDIGIIGTADNALNAISLILQQKPDLIFLDVQMPGYTGFDVLEHLTECKSKVIFTTAHKDYAIEALRKGAFDYLLKPIDADDLMRCINRALAAQDRKPETYPHTVELSVKNGIIFIKTQDIIRLEASGSYTTIYLDKNVKHMGSKSMKEYEKLLDPDVFYRCHNSHIVNLKKVSKFISGDGLFAEMSDGSLPEISRKNKDEFLSRLKCVMSR